MCRASLFQHTAARRRLEPLFRRPAVLATVSTHSRPKAAGHAVTCLIGSHVVSTHSRPKAAGHQPGQLIPDKTVSTHSRPKAAGVFSCRCLISVSGFNTQPPEGGWLGSFTYRRPRECFNTQPPEGGWAKIKTPAAHNTSFNTQPPEGGWIPDINLAINLKQFQHTAARRRLDS